MSLLEEPLTYEDYMRIEPGDRIRYEIIDGELLWSHTPPIAHQQVAGNLLMMVGKHIHKHQPGELIIGPVDVRLSTYDIVVPDFIYVRAERRSIYKATGLFDGSPDFVVETLSPETRIIDLTRKVALYTRARVPEYWIPDPMKRVFRLLTLRNGKYEDVEPIDGLFHSTVFEGLTIDPAELFEGLDD